MNNVIRMIKLVVLYRNRKQIGDLLTSLHEGVYKPDHERGGDFERLCIKQTLSRSTFQMVCYALSILIVIALGLTTSLKSRFTQPQEMWKLGFAPISLVNTTYSPRFEIAYVYQSLGIFMISLLVYTNDVTVISIIAQMGAQIKIFERAVRNYEQIGLKQHVYRRHVTAEKSISDTLSATIDHHITILDTVDTIEYLCSYLALSVFIANCVLLCLLMYYTSLMPMKSLEFFMYFVYCILIAIQVLLYCWWGNEMTLANEALALAVAETYNPYEPISHAKALKLMMIRAQRPLFLTAGKFVPLSLDTYKAIIKGSFSYFMVLRQVNTSE